MFLKKFWWAVPAMLGWICSMAMMLAHYAKQYAIATLVAAVIVSLLLLFINWVVPQNRDPRKIGIPNDLL